MNQIIDRLKRKKTATEPQTREVIEIILQEASKNDVIFLKRKDYKVTKRIEQRSLFHFQFKK